MAEEKSGWKWLKYGCFGCLGILGFFVILAAAVSGMAMLAARSEKVEEQVLTRDAPGAPVADAPGVAAPGGTCGSSKPGQVSLELSGTALTVEPGAPGEALRVVAKYDTRNFELDESYEELEDRWIYRVSFKRTRSGMVVFLKQVFGGTSPEITIYLPPDVPLDLDLAVNQGGGRVDLGGLCLRSAKLIASQGGFEIRVAEPLQAPMEHLTIEASMGGISIKELGNASPRKLDVTCNMGGMELDLRGEWVADSEIALKTRMGGAEVRLPRDVNIEGIADRAPRGSLTEREIPLPTLRFSTDLDDSGGVEFVD